MNIQATKLELIKMIADIRNEKLLERLKQFLREAGEEGRKKPVPTLSEEASRLLLKINEGLPEEMQLRYNELISKSVKETLTKKEHEELLELVPKVEAKSAERLKYLAQLAKLWEVSVDEVMNRLGIQPPPVIHA